MVLAGLGAGGAERVIALLTAHWVKQGHDVTVVAFDRESDPVFHDFDPRVRLVRLGLPPDSKSFGGALLRATRRVLRLRQALQRLQPDMVIGFLLKTNIVTLLACRGLGVRVMVSERNHPVRGTGNTIWRRLRDWLYPMADAIVLQTEASLAMYPAEIVARSTVIPNPITAYARRPEPIEGQTLVAVGRLDPQKGFDMLLEAFAMVAGRHPDWRLVIWGEGPIRRELEDHRDRLGLGDRVDMPGTTQVPGGWVESASAFVLSSRFEGFGNAIAEALAAGLPIVAFSCEFGIEAMLRGGQDGLLVPPENVPELAGAIDLLLSNKALRDEYSVKSRQSAVRFEPETVFSQWDRLLGSVCANRANVGA